MLQSRNRKRRQRPVVQRILMTCRCFLSHLYIKTIILPRQVQDKHTESQTKRREKRFRAQVYLSAGQAAHVLHAVADHPGQVRQRLRCCCCSEASHRHRRRVGRHRLGVNCCRNSVKDQPCAKWSPSCFECFPYVCLEPVLVKKIVLYTNGAKSGVDQSCAKTRKLKCR
jgi:hypothetical protein